MAVESKEVCPVESAGLVHFQETYNIHIRYMLVDCAGLCRTKLFWSPKRCPVESVGLVHFQETYNIHIRYMFGGLCQTVLDWTLLESKEVCPVESAGLSWTGLFWSPPDRTTRMRLESTGIHWNPLESTGIHWNE